tara:strand:- start:457 stop:1311 length:855 start_codon:yes stop_codon:yes gene_type:complete
VNKNRCGKILISGFPNAGKSTLLNSFFKKKMSIVSPKIQTTNKEIKAILNFKETQMIFIDTPGIITNKKYFNKEISRSFTRNSSNVDINLFVLDVTKKLDEKQINSIKKITENHKKNFLILNKIDLSNKEKLFFAVKSINNISKFSETFLISAKKKKGLKILLNKIVLNVPYGSWIYENNLNNEDLNDEISEITREKIFRLLNKELPYIIKIKTDLVYQKKILKIFQKVFVKKESQKAILIGKNGNKIKDIGSRARIDIEKKLKRKVFLDIIILNSKKNYENQR